MSDHQNTPDLAGDSNEPGTEFFNEFCDGALFEPKDFMNEDMEKTTSDIFGKPKFDEDNSHRGVEYMDKEFAQQCGDLENFYPVYYTFGLPFEGDLEVDLTCPPKTSENEGKFHEAIEEISAHQQGPCETAGSPHRKKSKVQTPKFTLQQIEEIFPRVPNQFRGMACTESLTSGIGTSPVLSEKKVAGRNIGRVAQWDQSYVHNEVEGFRRFCKSWLHPS
jgi:flavodoxin